MNTLEEIAERKRALIEKGDVQRTDLMRVYYGWQARTMAARQVANTLKNPFVLAGIGLVLLKMPWRRAYSMSGWAWKGWRLIRLFRRLF
jgi:hypothetical protein